MRITLPNQITIARLGLALLFFALLTLYQAGAAGQEWILHACFWLFLLAAVGDALDGHLARTLGQVTTFGRIVDPVADKVMICGAFIYFASPHFVVATTHANVTTLENVTGVAPWMAIVILVRELLITAIRSHSEAQGESFAAIGIGKLKMVVQATTACIILGQLAWNLTWLAPLRVGAVWATVIITAFSTISYVRRAHSFLLTSAALGGAPKPPAPPDSGARPAADTNSTTRTTATMRGGVAS